MEHDNEIRRLEEFKKKIEERTAENQRTEARLETLLDQANSRYGKSTVEELEAYRDEVYAKYNKAMEEVKSLNAQLSTFFAGV